MNQTPNESQTLLVTLSVSELRELVREAVREELSGGKAVGPAREGKFLSVDKLAEILDVPRSWVYSRLSRRDGKQIPHVRVGKYRKFLLSEVLTWMRSGGKADRG